MSKSANKPSKDATKPKGKHYTPPKGEDAPLPYSYYHPSKSKGKNKDDILYQ